MRKLQTALTVDFSCLVKSVIFLLFVATAHAANENATSTEAIIKERPIVIHTQAQHYEQPTLSDYTKCHENLDSCIAVCATADDPATCTKQCPTCPLLLEGQLVVQGVNDTDFKPAPETPFNTTNIIRLTNEIRNIISNQHVETNKPETNNKTTESSSSTTGGKYGLGFNEQGSCCILVNATQNCRRGQRISQERCHRRHQRVCGERCTARVVHEHPSKSQRRRAAKCHYITQWPFVACGHRTPVNHCQKCLSLPYGVILQHGIPPNCISCYEPQDSRGYGPYADLYGPPAYYKGYPPYYYDDQNDITDEDYWKTEEIKCRNKDGSITQHCSENSENSDREELGSGDDTAIDVESTASIHLASTAKPLITTTDPLQLLPEAAEAIDDYPNGSYEADKDRDPFSGVEAVRRRRDGFLRSAYSIRYRNQN